MTTHTHPTRRASDHAPEPLPLFVALVPFLFWFAVGTAALLSL